MKLYIPIIIFLQILFSQCDSLSYSESEYYHYTTVDINHIGSTLDCYYIADWEILDDLITINNLSEIDVAELGYQNWDSNGRLKNFTLNYSSSSSPQYIDQKINALPENFGDLKMLESLEMYYHDLTVFPLSFPQLENLMALNMKGNKLKILNPDFGSLSSLEVLDLGYNDLVALPESISSLSNVNYFWIFGNDISYIPESICELDLDWSGELGDFIYFGSGGNHLCGDDIPICVESSLHFNIMLEEQGYAFQIESDQVCACSDGSYPDCMDYCPNNESYGFIIDACGLCTSLEDACTSDCTGLWGGSASIDECGICDGDGSNCEDVGMLSLDFDILNNDTYVIYDTPENDNWGIGGFQFDVEGTSDFSQSGGVASEMGFSVTISSQLILGFSFSGAVIPPGRDTLLVLTSEEIITGLTNITISDAISQPAQSLNFLFDDGNLETCDSEYDCLGICNGSAAIDECGICNGLGVNTWYLDSDGDGLGDLQSSSNFCYEPDGYTSNFDDSDDSIFCPYQYLDANFDCFGICTDEVDCAGECGGSLVVDECGECGGTITNLLDCTVICEEEETLGCDNICYMSGNELKIDDCGICGGDSLSCVDCNGEINGSAFTNSCGCVEGTTGLDENYCFGCKDTDATNYCEECTIKCNYNNSCCEYDLSNESVIIPIDFGIQSNYPNPFNPETTINYSIPQLAWVSLSIFDVKGELVLNIFEGFINPGNYSVNWNGNNYRNQQMPTGIYFSILTSNENSVSHKLLLMK